MKKAYLSPYSPSKVPPKQKLLLTSISSITVKPLSHRRVYLILDAPEGCLIERGLIGDLFTKSSDKDIFGSFSVLLSHILQNQRLILRLKT